MFYWLLIIDTISSIDLGIIVMSLAILLITGFCLYVFIKNPVKSFQSILKGTAIVTLGFAACFGLFYFLMDT